MFKGCFFLRLYTFERLGLIPIICSDSNLLFNGPATKVIRINV